MRDTEFSILVFVSGFWSRYTRRVLDALDIPEGGTVSVSITYAMVFERVTLAGSTVSVVAFTLACFYCSHCSNSNLGPECSSFESQTGRLS